MYVAAELNRVEALMVLLTTPGIDVNVQITEGESFDMYDGYTPLCIAVDNNSFECAKLLIEHPSTDLNQGYNHQGVGPLYMAAYMGYTPFVELLCGDERVDMNRANIEDGTTALFRAIEGSASIECVNLLLDDIRTDVNKATLDGATPLMMAAANGDEDAVEFLLMDTVQDLAFFFPKWRSLYFSVFLCNSAFGLKLPMNVIMFILSFLRPRTNVDACMLESKWCDQLLYEFRAGKSALDIAKENGEEGCVALILDYKNRK